MDLANTFLVYYSLLENPTNDFENMDKKIYKDLVEPKVIKAVVKDAQSTFGDIEVLFEEAQKTLTQMKSNPKDNTLISELSKDIEN